MFINQQTTESSLSFLFRSERFLHNFYSPGVQYHNDDSYTLTYSCCFLILGLSGTEDVVAAAIE